MRRLEATPEVDSTPSFTLEERTDGPHVSHQTSG